MFFGWNMFISVHSVIWSYMVPRMVISGHYDVIYKKIKNINFAIFGMWVFFPHLKYAYSNKQ